MLCVQRVDGVEDYLVAGGVEVVYSDKGETGGDGLGINEQGAEKSLLGALVARYCPLPGSAIKRSLQSLLEWQ
jgi:hypothetical protein